MNTETEIKIQQATWTANKPQIQSVRRTVFIEEQHVPENMEWDDDDTTAIHCLALSNNKPIATGRLLSSGQIGRMAVLNDFRHQGIGSKILAFLIKYHQRVSDKPVIIHAQTHAIKFYKQFGFKIQGDEYIEAGIPHYTMILKNE